MRAIISLSFLVISSAHASVEDVPVAVLHYPGLANSVERLTAANYGPDGTLLIAASESGRAQIWDTRTLSSKWKCDVTEPGAPTKADGRPILRDARFSPDGGRVILSGSRGNAWLWTLADGDCQPQALISMKGHTDDVRTAEFSRDGRRILTTSNDQTVRLWDGRGQLISTFDLGGTAGLFTTSAAFSPDGKTAVASRSDGLVVRIDFEGAVVTRLREPTGTAVWQVTFTTDGQSILTASEDGEVALWSTKGVRQKVLLASGGPSANSISVSADGQLIAVGLAARKRLGQSARVMVVSLSDPDHQHALPSGTESVSEVNFSPDGGRIVVGSFDGLVRMWRVPTTLGTVIGPIGRHVP